MIRAMTTTEIVAGLRRAAAICVEQQRSDWDTVDVCRADDVFRAAALLWVGPFLPGELGYTDTPEHAATFLLLCAEAHDAA